MIKYNIRLTSADWQRGSARVIRTNVFMHSLSHLTLTIVLNLQI